MKTAKPDDFSPHPPERPEPMPLERMRELTRKVVAVPKIEAVPKPSRGKRMRRD